ncbi:hypothetical protein SEUCBS139899_003021 [Sporothrix eucalyptigena]|uniref:Major facilitator superfamily (MFS) profile domain-containing protein n=1 Tax=Sporothrix eucalyptigena TaxID=1812306 RepID=A0ABP0CVL0_9PEZI
MSADEKTPAVPEHDENHDYDLEKPRKDLAADDPDHANALAYKGDDSDGKIEWTVKSAFAMCFLCALYTASMIMLYFTGAALSYIEKDLGAANTGTWLPVSNTLAIAAVAPFVGYLQDLLGRRYITLAGSVVIMVGLAITGSAKTFGAGVAGMALCGAGAAVCELTALAGVSDIVPVKHRGTFLALMIVFLLPFTPYVLYAQLLSSRSTWRWCMWISLIYNGVVFLGLLFTYFPKAHPRMAGVTKRDILKQIDYVGAVLSIVGLTIFLVALQAGGYSHPWNSVYVLSQLIIGLVMIIAWIAWEWKFAKWPMVPRQLFQGQYAVGLSFFVAFVAGINFYSLINFFPLTFSTVYNPDPVQIGLKGLGYGISVTSGAMFFNALLSVKSLHCRWPIAIASAIMTVFGGALVTATPYNAKQTVALGTIAGFGVGGILVPAATLALIVVPDSLLATTAALSLSVRTVGGSIGYTVYFNIFSKKLTSALPAYVVSAVMGAGLPEADVPEFVATFLGAEGGAASLADVPGYTTAIAEAATMASRSAYADAFKYVWYTSIPFGCLAVIAALFLPSIRKFQTNRVAVTL